MWDFCQKPTILTSWRSFDDPAPGNFKFQIDQERVNQFIIRKRTTRYWKSGVSGKFIGPDGIPSAMPSVISFFLSNFTSVVLHNESMPHLTSPLYSDTRMIIGFFGQIQYFKWDSNKIWSIIWTEPRDKCSIYNACGNFDSCNTNNDLMICNKNAKIDRLLSLKMIEVWNPASQFNAMNEMECKFECLRNCQCQAYSYEEPDVMRQGSSSIAACWLRLEDLHNIQEEYQGGRNANVRLAVSDVESTRSCETCVTNLIPYPLSTGLKCGDALYRSLRCNTTSGEVTFDVPSGTYTVTSIDPETRKFIIQTNDANNCKEGNSCDDFFQFKQPSPFHVTSRCTTDEVEKGWDPPLEPTCSSPTDCKDWPNSTCNAASEGNKRCLCHTNFRWDKSLNCTEDNGYRKKRYKSSTRKMALSLILVIACISVVVLIVVSGAIVYVYLKRKKLTKGEALRNSALHLYGSERHVKDLIDSGRFKDDDTGGIEVPFFHLESILAATKNFSNANKLGRGGFGSVYKGKFPGGQEIAVKRLSSCSGQGLEEFKNEVVPIARLQHRNLVRLLDYCVAGDENMLLYEYMPNKSGSYMSPEYDLDGLFSFKSDVFSFGVVVIEIVTGKRNTGFYQPEKSLSLLGYAWHMWKADKAIDLLDQTLRETCKADELLKCLNVGLLRCPSSKASSSSKPEAFSQNELTVTLEHGRHEDKASNPWPLNRGTKGYYMDDINMIIMPFPLFTLWGDGFIAITGVAIGPVRRAGLSESPDSQCRGGWKLDRWLRRLEAGPLAEAAGGRGGWKLGSSHYELSAGDDVDLFLSVMESFKRLNKLLMSSSHYELLHPSSDEFFSL
ncbi:G-type lectin S-receptor-like serine/threonine-protein kinase [Hibiscus syriacus]|uniref:G-type lectin S-receptor-like serine/threonine-protein kinase n=1 Tax=Hibiscus syriacus TaxID=106335 RepID=A0A6A2Y991_HIBSY|nr:G-type lectin S-receptor-like serine/threonine-protein kinase [Hibiscus syriacus]